MVRFADSAAELRTIAAEVATMTPAARQAEATRAEALFRATMKPALLFERAGVFELLGRLWPGFVHA